MAETFWVLAAFWFILTEWRRSQRREKYQRKLRFFQTAHSTFLRSNGDLSRHDLRLFKRAYLSPWPPWVMVTMGRPPSLISPWRHWDELRKGCASYALGRQRQSARMPWVKVSTASSTWERRWLFGVISMIFHVCFCIFFGGYCIVGLLHCWAFGLFHVFVCNISWTIAIAYRCNIYCS